MRLKWPNLGRRLWRLIRRGSPARLQPAAGAANTSPVPTAPTGLADDRRGSGVSFLDAGYYAPPPIAPAGLAGDRKSNTSSRASSLDAAAHDTRTLSLAISAEVPVFRPWSEALEKQMFGDFVRGSSTIPGSSSPEHAIPEMDSRVATPGGHDSPRDSQPARESPSELGSRSGVPDAPRSGFPVSIASSLYQSDGSRSSSRGSATPGDATPRPQSRASQASSERESPERRKERHLTGETFGKRLSIQTLGSQTSESTDTPWSGWPSAPAPAPASAVPGRAPATLPGPQSREGHFSDSHSTDPNRSVSRTPSQDSSSRGHSEGRGRRP
jgi:hypothetical protein